MGRKSNLFLVGLFASHLWAGTVVVDASPDVIGNPLQFAAQSVAVTTGPGTLTIDIRTNFDNQQLHSFRDTGVRLDIGDLFFTINGAYAYGIPLAYHNGPAGGPWGDRLYAGHVYAIDDPSALLTARQTLHDPMYVDYRPDAIVWMVDLGDVQDVTAGIPTVQVLPIAGDNGVNGPLYDIHVTTSLPAGLFSSPTDTYGLHWAVATCGNDLVDGILNLGGGLHAQTTDPAVPEPSTWYMMIGAALVVAARFTWRRHSCLPGRDSSRPPRAPR